MAGCRGHRLCGSPGWCVGRSLKEKNIEYQVLAHYAQSPKRVAHETAIPLDTYTVPRFFQDLDHFRPGPSQAGAAASAQLLQGQGSFLRHQRQVNKETAFAPRYGEGSCASEEFTSCNRKPGSSADLSTERPGLGSSPPPLPPPPINTLQKPALLS